jgi:hypothetical protein
LNRTSFKGKCVVQKVDQTTGVIVASFGNFSFTVDARDGDLLTPRSFDAYAITVLDSSGVIWRRLGTNAALLPLGGGNVMVKAK